MPSRKMWVTWEDGTELSNSRQSPGDYSPLTRESGTLVGQVTLSDVDDDDANYQWQPEPDPEPNPVLEFLGYLALIGVVFAADRAAPHVRRLWGDKAVPLSRRVKRKLTRSRSPKPPAPPVSLAAITVVVPASQEGSPDVIEALADFRRATMSTAEARERLIAALVARMFSDQQLRVLRDARIGDDDPMVDLLNSVETLTPEQLAASLRSMLALDSSSPDTATISQLLARLPSHGADPVPLPPPSASSTQRAE
jgi:hypothetical protein